MSDDDLRERLSLYALGLLDAEDALILDRHLAEGCADCEACLLEARETVSMVSLVAPVAPPPPSLRQRVIQAVTTKQSWKAWEDSGDVRLHVVRRHEGVWDDVAPGVRARRLYVDKERDSVTMMVRMEPGASYAPHRHGGPEQCFVLEGDVFDGEQWYHAGDFQCAQTGSVHDVQRTETGCLLLIVSSLRDQLLA